MSVARFYTVRGMSKPKSKKDVSKTFCLAFVLPSQMPEGFTAQRVKGTGKTPNLPAGMTLVWSVTHDSWRSFNLAGCLDLQSFEFDVAQFDTVAQAHKDALALATPEVRLMWGLDK
jgi:hypothetical protein